MNTLKCEIKRVGQNNKIRGGDSEIKETGKIKEKKIKEKEWNLSEKQGSEVRGDVVAHGGGRRGGEGNKQEDRSNRGGVRRTEVEFDSRGRDTHRIRKNSEEIKTLEEDMSSISDGRE
jgi:hypothetical protein